MNTKPKYKIEDGVVMALSNSGYYAFLAPLDGRTLEQVVHHYENPVSQSVIEKRKEIWKLEQKKSTQKMLNQGEKLMNSLQEPKYI